MKAYITIIQWLQQFLLGVGIAILVFLPLVIMFDSALAMANSTFLYEISHNAVFFVMLIRPLSDIFSGLKPLRTLVVLRKGFGVLSASIVISFLIASIAMNPAGFFTHFISSNYWSLGNYVGFGHLADVAGVVLLITSNNLSKRLLGVWWKRVQKLSYVYFYASAIFVFGTYGTMYVFYYMVIITFVTFLAFLLNRARRAEMGIPRTV